MSRFSLLDLLLELAARRIVHDLPALLQLLLQRLDLLVLLAEFRRLLLGSSSSLALAALPSTES